MLGGDEFTVERQHVQVACGLADFLFTGDDHVVQYAGKAGLFQFGACVAGLRVAQQRHDHAGVLQLFDHVERAGVQPEQAGAALAERPCGFQRGLR